MADLVITAANVVVSANARINNSYNAGVAITAGQTVYLVAATSKWGLAQSDGTSSEATVRGIALHAAAADQPLAVLEDGDLTIGATIAAGVWYYLSNTAGGICPVADLGTADYVSVIGYGISTTVLRMHVHNTGVVLA